MRGILGGTLPVLCVLVLAGAAAGDTCWDSVQEGHDLGFDFVIQADVQGPGTQGVAAYTYKIYRVDQGQITYRDPSHLSIQFACDGQGAADLVIGGLAGLLVSGAPGAACELELADDPQGMAEPGLGSGCRVNGLKITLCSGALVPDGDGISYPADPDDPVLVIRFLALGGSQDGEWVVKGGRKLDGDLGFGSSSHRDVVFLTDGGGLPVPGCIPVVPVEAVSWGRVKSLYR